MCHRRENIMDDIVHNIELMWDSLSHLSYHARCVRIGNHMGLHWQRVWRVATYLGLIAPKQGNGVKEQEKRAEQRWRDHCRSFYRPKG